MQSTGFVNRENVNEAGVWSLGLLQMDFFYRKKAWYAGQFVRKIIPQIEIPESTVLFFQALLNRLKTPLLDVLVRNVNNTFENLDMSLPITDDKKIDFEFMEQYIKEIENNQIKDQIEYFKACGMDDIELDDEEQQAIRDFQTLKWQNFDIPQEFIVSNTHSILSSDIKENSGNVPYLCASTEDNGVSSYVSYDEQFLDKGNCIFIGGKTFVVSYQEKDFFSNDSHNLALYVRNTEPEKMKLLYLATCVNKSLGHKYFWDDSISSTKIQKDKITLPVRNGKPDYSVMHTLIKAVQKIVLKEIVKRTDEKIVTGNEKST